MPSVPPPLWPTTTLIPAGGATMTAGVIGSLPPEILARLTPGTTLEARILSTGRGPVTVLLPGSEQPVSLRLPMSVPAGGTLLLQAMAQGGEGAVLKLLAVNPPPSAPNNPPAGTAGANPPVPGPSLPVPPPAGATTPVPGQPAPSAGAPAGAAGPANAAPAPLGIIATLLRPTVADLPPGTLLTVRIAAQTPPPSAGATGAPLPPGASAPSSPAPVPAPPPSAGASSGAAAPSSPAPPPPGGIPSAAPPSAQGMAGTASLPPQSLTGTVASNSYAGQPLVATSLGLLSLATPQTFPPGTSLLLDIVGLPGPPAAAGSPAPPPIPWPALTNAADILSRAAPEALIALAARLPQPGAQLAASLFTLFSTAVRGTQPRWLTGITDVLDKVGRRDLAEAAIEEMDSLIGKPLRGRGGDDWQSWLLPLLVDGRIERIRLMTRPQPRDEEEKNRRGQEGVRFLLDLDLSRLGPMQLDGLIRRDARRFDLILRTHTPLPGEMRQDIRRIFTAALDGMGMTGEAGFQRADRFVAPEPPPEPPDMTV